MLAGIERAKKAPEFPLSVLAGAAKGAGRDLALAGRKIGAERIADLEAARRALADVSGVTHLLFSRASFEAVEGDSVSVRAELGVSSSACARARLKPITAMSALSDGGTAR